MPSYYTTLKEVYLPIYRDIYNNLDKLNSEDYNSKHDLKKEFTQLYKTADNKTFLRGMFRIIKKIYDNQTFDQRNLNRELKDLNKDLNNINKKVEDKRVLVDDLKSLNETAKREIEINMNKSRKMRHTNKVLMYVMLIVGVLFILPVLNLAKILPMQAAIGLWCLGLVGILAFIFYQLNIKNLNRDEHEFDRYNFMKPTDKEIAKSKALAQLSEKDKTRCQAFAELEAELDIPDRKVDYREFTSKVDQSGSCPNDN